LNLLFFIRLLLRHIVILTFLPIVLVVLVYYLTRDQQKEYVTSTRVYTGITTGSSIVSLESSKVDLFATRTSFDNLINIINARSTMEEVSIRLLATHLMLDGPKAEIISKKSYDELLKIVPEKVKALVVKNNLEKTIHNFRKHKESSYDNFIYELINYHHPHYSSEKISAKIKVRRVQTSDLIEISYSSSDPGICKGTLDILIHVFISEYTNIKVNQSDAVVKYFENQLEQSNAKLNEAENELLVFNQENVIINYYEQTKHVSAEKQLFNMRHLEIKLENAGAKTVIETLENKMSVRQKQRLNNETIMGLRQELARTNLNIAIKTFEEKVQESDEETLVTDIGELRLKAFDIEQQLKEMVKEQYNIDHSTEGVATQSVLEDWIDHVIVYEASKAQLQVAELQEKQFIRLFENYAPLGATMKRLERKISVAEREYLSILHSLGIAKLNQQNIELTSNLKIVSEPLFPIVAQPGKRKLLLAVAFLIGFIIPAFVIVVLEFLDPNLKTAARTEAKTGLSVAAIFPNLAGQNKKVDVELIKQRGLDIIARRLILIKKEGDIKMPDKIIFFSISDSEGKSTLIMLLTKKLIELGYKTLFFTPGSVDSISGIDIRNYQIDNSFHRADKINELDSELNETKLSAYDYVFIEIPAILTNYYPIKLFNNADHSFLVIRANRPWTMADKNALKDISEYTPDNKPQVLLNGVELMEMETVIGDLPKKRSWIRRTMKTYYACIFSQKTQ
jgi:polysaccharide biosynthesis transport protein